MDIADLLDDDDVYNARSVRTVGSDAATAFP